MVVCAQCKYDYCWICLEEWKKHSSSTGGYYRCTRYEVIQQLEEQSKEMTVEVHTHTHTTRGDSTSSVRVLSMVLTSQARPGSEDLPPPCHNTTSRDI